MQTKFPVANIFVTLDQIESSPLEIRDRLTAGEQLVLTVSGVAVAKLGPHSALQKADILVDWSSI